MDIFSQVTDPIPLQSSSPSSSSSSSEGILLATSRPKKRAGRRVFKETRHPIFRGIRRRNNDKWVCELREPNKKTRIWLGTYPDPEMAARAHDVAALALRGKSACLNFADSTWRLPVPASADAKDIRKAAAEAAEAFRPRDDVKLSEEEVSMAEEKVFYMDEEAVFDMPGLLVNMAEGLLLSPPPLLLGDDDMKWDDYYGQSDGSVSLWSHSI